ncbi:immunoglobulin domain-containing protein, partial [Leucobacter sp.]
MNVPGSAMLDRPLHRPLALLIASALALTGLVAADALASPPAQAAEQTYTHVDGATVTYDSEVVAGEPIPLSGTHWTTKAGHSVGDGEFDVREGDEGSIIGVKFMAGGATGNALRTQKVVNPWNGDTDYASPDVWDIVQAAGTGEWWDEQAWPGVEYGEWRTEIPWPTAEIAQNPPALQPGDTFSLQLLSGTLYGNTVGNQGLRPDVSRTVNLSFTVVAPAPEVSLSTQQVEQHGDLWFTLSGFAPGAQVIVDLVDAEGATVVSKPFAIGADGNTDDPDGQTYRKLTVPRDAVAGGDYAVIVRDAGSGEALASSGAVTVTAATTRVFNPGDHAGGVEDLLVQQGGTWTFRAVGFAPGGTLTATAEIGGETVELGGIGQISASEKAWRLDANGDTSREGFTRVQLPETAPEGPLEVTFGDGETQLSRTLVIESPPEAVVTVASSAQIGGTVRVSGEGFLHPDGEQGSRVAIKIDDGAYSRLDSSTHQNRTIWWIVDADANGAFSVDMPVPNGTGADSGATLGSQPALVPGSAHTLRLLTGSLKTGDRSRTLQSSAFSVTAAPDPGATPPVVTAGPKSVSVVDGSPAAFTAKASGSPVPSVRWESRKGSGSWAPVAGATSSTLRLAKVSAGLSGTQYRA